MVAEGGSVVPPWDRRGSATPGSGNVMSKICETEAKYGECWPQTMRWKPRNVKNQFKQTIKTELKISVKNTLLKLLVKKYIKRNTIFDCVVVKEVKFITTLRNTNR